MKYYALLPLLLAAFLILVHVLDVFHSSEKIPTPSAPSSTTSDTFAMDERTQTQEDEKRRRRWTLDKYDHDHDGSLHEDELRESLVDLNKRSTTAPPQTATSGLASNDPPKLRRRVVLPVKDSPNLRWRVTLPIKDPE